MKRALLAGTALVFALGASGFAAAQRSGPAPASPRASAPIDLTGYWVAVVSEDWRHRMATPRKGDYESLPLNAEGRRVARDVVVVPVLRAGLGMLDAVLELLPAARVGRMDPARILREG